MEDNENFVEIELQIWERNLNDEALYDYKNDKSQKYSIPPFNDKNLFVIKANNNDIQLIKNHKEFNSNEGEVILFRIRKSLKSNIYEIINPINQHKINTNYFNINYLNYKMWYPVKSSRNIEGNKENYSLNENDIIKFGKKKYMVTKLHFNNNNNISYISAINKNSKSLFNIDIKTNQYKINNNKIPEKSQKRNEEYKQIFKISEKNKNESINENSKSYESGIKYTIDNESESENEYEYEYEKCWLCLNSYSDIDNPLICLCNCHNYIHYKCLKMYLISKIKIYENSKKTVTTYICEKFNCDICLKPYHLRFRIPEFDKTYDLIDLSSSENTDYIYLESLDYIKDNKNIKTLHIVNLEDPEITIGRNNYNDIIDNDISISRGHAVLKYNKNEGNLFLEDKNSKYGTEVLVRGNIKLTKKRSFFLIWDTYISIKVLD